MTQPLRAEDLLPLVLKLSQGERTRLAKLALAAPAGDAAAYRAHPVSPEELGSDEDGLGWEAEGWDEPRAAG